MNKIERAIHDTKIDIKILEREHLVIGSKLQAFKDILDKLEYIESNKQIPHENK